jgi:pSer/pThr/pTyr-binding forkhead associated (FHA) protein
MSAQLVALTDGRIIQVDKAILVVGRHAECDVQILSPKISRLHCCLAQVGEFLVVRDLNSTNGVRVNGVRLIEGRLGAGDELTIGTHRYQVRGEGLAAKAAAPRPAADKLAAVPKKKGVTAKELESYDVPVALPEPDAPFRKKAKKTTTTNPVSEPDEDTVGPVEPPLVELVEEEAPPMVEAPAPPAPPHPGNLELVSSSDEFQNPSSHHAP